MCETNGALVADLKRSVEGLLLADSMELPDQLSRCFGKPSRVAKPRIGTLRCVSNAKGSLGGRPGLRYVVHPQSASAGRSGAVADAPSLPQTGMMPSGARSISKKLLKPLRRPRRLREARGSALRLAS